MALELSWYLPRRVLVARVYGRVTDRDESDLERQVRELLDGVGDGSVHLILDLSDVEAIETVISPAQPVVENPAFAAHPGLGLRVTVRCENNPLLRYWHPVMTLGDDAEYPCPTLQDAVAYLCQLDETLPVAGAAALARPA